MLCKVYLCTHDITSVSPSRAEVTISGAQSGAMSSSISDSPVNLSSSKRNGRLSQTPESSRQQKMKMSKGKGPKGLLKVFQRGKAKENGVVPVRPSCFNDDFVRTPETMGQDSPSRPASAKEYRPYALWRHKVREYLSTRVREKEGERRRRERERIRRRKARERGLDLRVIIRCCAWVIGFGAAALG